MASASVDEPVIIPAIERGLHNLLVKTGVLPYRNESESCRGEPRKPSALRFAPTSSIQPVLDSQAGDLDEVLRVPGQDGGVVRESDAGDLQVQRADAQALAPELDE